MTKIIALKSKSKISMHQGEGLFRIAAHYPTLMETILEQIQNAIDAMAAHIWVTINKNARYITVSDNGEGVSKQQFDKTLQAICISQKIEGKLGRFGMGLISPLGKCEKFTFTSTSKAERDNYYRWIFDPNEIRKQKDSIEIPVETNLNFCFGNHPSQGKTEVPWRTSMRIEKYSKDRIISRTSLDALADGILERYGPVMRRNKIIVSVRIRDENGDEFRDITARPFGGKLLSEETITDHDAGNTIFKLYLTRHTDKGRQGKVYIGEINDDFRLSFSAFSKTAKEWLGEDVVQCLNSGFFEGEILSSKAKLHAGRRAFEEDVRLVGFCAAIETWFKQIGYKYVTEAKEAKQEQRYQQIGIQALKNIEELIRQPEFSFFQELISSFKKGTIGVGHTKVSQSKIVDTQNIPSISISGNPGESKELKNIGSQGREIPEREHVGHQPFTVVGPRGHRRTIVKSNSLGFQLAYEYMTETPNKLWDFNPTIGILTFNVGSKSWTDCEKNDRTLLQLKEYVILQVLVLYTLSRDWIDHYKDAYNALIKPFVFLIGNMDCFTGRKRPSK